MLLPCFPAGCDAISIIKNEMNPNSFSDFLGSFLFYSMTYCLFQLSVAIGSIVAKLLLDAKQLVVLSHAVGAAQRTGLDLAAVGGNSNVGDSSVLGLTAAV